MATSAADVALYAAFDRIDQLDGTLHAYITVCREAAGRAETVAVRPSW